MVKLWSSKPSLWVRFPFPLFVLIMVFLNFFYKSLFPIFTQNKNIVNIFSIIINWFIYLLLLPLGKNKINTLNIFEMEKTVFNFCFYINILDIFIIFFSRLNNQKNVNFFKFKVDGLNNNGFYFFNNMVVMKNTQLLLYGLRSC